MSLAEEPCLYQYFIFLVKEKGVLNEPSIFEAQELWDKLCNIFKIESKTPRLIESIRETRGEIYFDKRVKRLATINTNDNMVLVEQVLAHDILILCIVLNTPRNYKTDAPEKSWAQQLEIIPILKELSYIYGNATVLQSITNEPQQVAVLIQRNLPEYKSKQLTSCTIDFGKVWQFGSQYKYLLTIKRENEESANRFLAYNFAYIISLISKIDKHYMLAVKLYETTTNQELQVDELRINLDNLLKTTDSSLLERKRDEIRYIGEETTNNVAYLRDCGSNIQSNIINLKDAIKDLNIVADEDEIFSNNFELFEEHVQNINSWVTVCDSVLMRINKATIDFQAVLKERIEILIITKQAQEIASAIPGAATSSVEISFKLGNNYIINESELGKSLSIFEQILELKNPGLSITRTHPDKFKKSQNLKNATTYWLSNTSCDYCLPPSLAKILHVITPFLLTYEKSVLLLEGLEYLITNNDFNKVLKLVDNIKELVSMHNSALILPVSYPAFSEKELTLIKKNMVDFTGAKVEVGMLITE